MPKSELGTRVGIGAAPLCAALLALTTSLGPAFGQELDDFEQRGIRWGGFNIFSELGLGVAYTDNVFAVPSEGITVGDFTLPKDGDFFMLIQPQVLIETDTERHRLYFLGNATIGRYNTYSSQDFNDFTLEAGGSYDVTRTFALDAFAGYDQGHENSSDPDRRTFVRTTTYDQVRAGVGMRKQWARTFARYNFNFRNQDYNDVQFAGVDLNAGRNNDRYINRLRVGYNLTRQYDLFTEVAYRITDFDNAPPPSRNRDQQAASLLFGTQVDIARVLAGEFAIGVDYATFNDESTSDQIGFSFAGGLDWTVTPRTVVGFEASRGFEPTDVVGASGQQVTQVGLTLSHALSRRLTLGALAGYEINDFLGVERQDETVNAGASAAYAFNRYLTVRATYDYTNRTSDQRFREFDENQFFLTLVGRY